MTKGLFTFLLAISLVACMHTGKPPLLDHERLANEYFGNDAKWFTDNIPFFECSDKQMEQVYYYRWKQYKAHIRRVGDSSYVITEFINHVAWDRDPWCTINAASMHHIYEGRWLTNSSYLDGYINYLFQEGGNNRHYSESISDAAYARYLVNGDAGFVTRQLDSMKRMFNEWSDHFDSSKQLYFIPAMPDATEYTIASIDASGGTGGFDDGEAYRPTINSYMYANALAIARIATLAGDEKTHDEYLQKAVTLRLLVTKDLWNDSLQHFTDRFKVDNQFVHHWNFIRGRELAGLIPWYFDLPPDSAKYDAAWKHAIDTSALLGAYGLRTNEPSYQYYFKQFVMYMGQRGSQWNGPSWPYQTSQVITGMANFLNDYHQGIIKNADYVKLLRLFTRQHYLPDGKIDLVENYDPNLGGPIVYYYWSNHYNHSSYNNLIISGLCGIRPSEGDTLTVNPLVDATIQYFCLDDVLYHGHRVSVVYDKDGSKYHVGSGVSVFVDGKKVAADRVAGKYKVLIGAPISAPARLGHADYALNIAHEGYPKPSASVNTVPDTSMYQAIDGRRWYFSEITNRWTSLGSKAMEDWYAIDFGRPRRVSAVDVSLFSNDSVFDAPNKITVEYNENNKWKAVTQTKETPAIPIGNTENEISFDAITTDRIRILFLHSKKQVAVSEIECY